MACNIISFYALYNDGFHFSFDNENCDILVYKNGYFYFKASLCNRTYENVICVSKSNYLIINIYSSENVSDKSRMWHRRLGHIK